VKRHKAKDSSGKNKVFYLHSANVDSPIQSVDCFVETGPDSKEDFEDFRYSDWQNKVDSCQYEGALVALTRHEAEKLYARLGRMLSE
jgi:hypothetical protein